MSLWAALGHLTATRPRLEQWQDSRFRFAHEIGRLLAGNTPDTPAVTGAVLYGVYLSGTGLAYVGQTQNAQRRLRDLPIGESHHIATTIPPEIWERVIVVQWSGLLQLTSPRQHDQVNTLGSMICGLALEHLLQVRRRPPLNARTRTSAGQWRMRNSGRSRSRGARSASEFAELFELVEQEWNALEATPLPQSQADDFRVIRDYGRVVFPSMILKAIPNLWSSPGYPA